MNAIAGVGNLIPNIMGRNHGSKRNVQGVCDWLAAAFIGSGRRWYGGDLAPRGRYRVKEAYKNDVEEPSRTRFMFRLPSGANFRN